MAEFNSYSPSPVGMTQAGPMLQAVFHPMLQSFRTGRAHSFASSLYLDPDKGTFKRSVYSQWKAVYSQYRRRCFFLCFSNGRSAGTCGWGNQLLPTGKGTIGWEVFIQLDTSRPNFPFSPWKFEVWVRTAVVLKQEGKIQHLSNTPSVTGKGSCLHWQVTPHIKY